MGSQPRRKKRTRKESGEKQASTEQQTLIRGNVPDAAQKGTNARFLRQGGFHRAIPQ
jgi:hypothetical protein